MCATSMARNNGLISAAKETFGMRFSLEFPDFEGFNKMLRSYRLSCGFCARRDGTVKTVREKAPLLHTCLPSKGQIKHLSRGPRCYQPITGLDGEGLLCLSARRRDQVHAVQSCCRYFQSHNLCPYSGSMLRLSPEKACRGCDDVRSLKKAGRARVRRNADVFQDASCSEEIVLIAEAETQSAQIDAGHGTCGRAQRTPEQDYMGAFVRTDL